jgi:hypothetical protein
MPKYKCENKECFDFDKEIIVDKSICKFVQGQFVDSASICLACGKIMKFIRPGEGFTTFIAGTNDVKRE